MQKGGRLDLERFAAVGWVDPRLDLGEAQRFLQRPDCNAYAKYDCWSRMIPLTNLRIHS